MNIIRPEGIWVPKFKIVEVTHSATRVLIPGGEFKIIKRNRWGRQLWESPWFDNVIFDAGLNRLGTSAAVSGAAIGTGTTAHITTGTGLGAEVHWTTTAGTGSGATSNNSSPYENTRTFVFRTALGALNGNYSEVAVGWAAGSNKFAASLILDGGGNPTTVSVASDEQLDIVYRCAIFPPLTDVSGTVSVTGVGSVDYTGRAIGVNVTTGSFNPSWAVQLFAPILNINGTNSTQATSLSAITADSISGTGNGGGPTVATAAYSNNSLTRNGTVTWAVSSGNIGAISLVQVRWTTDYCFQYLYDGGITKNDTQVLDLNFSMSWDRR